MLEEFRARLGALVEKLYASLLLATSHLHQRVVSWLGLQLRRHDGDGFVESHQFVLTCWGPLLGNRSLASLNAALKNLCEATELLLPKTPTLSPPKAKGGPGKDKGRKTNRAGAGGPK